MRKSLFVTLLTLTLCILFVQPGATALEPQALTIGVPFSDSVAGTGNEKTYMVNVAATGEHLFVILDSTGNGYNAELYIKFGAQPSTSNYDVKSSLPNADQAVEIAGTQVGTYYILVRSTYGGLSYTITAHTRITFPTLSIGNALSETIQNTWDMKFYQVSTGAGEHLSVVLDSAGNGNNAELYIRFGALPTTGVYDGKSGLPNADQVVDISSTQAGTYYVLVRSTYGGWSFTVTAHDGGTLPALSLGIASNGTTQGTWDVKFYQVSVGAGEHLSVVLDSSSNGSNGELYIRYGAFPTTSVYDRKSGLPNADQALDISSTQAGTYYILVRSTYGGWAFTLTAHSASTFPALAIGTPTNGTTQGTWDVKFYKVPTGAGEHLSVILDSVANGYNAELYIRFGALPTTSVFDSTSALPNSDQAVDIPSTQAGTYYILVRSTYGGWSFTLTAHTANTFPALAIGTLATGTMQATGDLKYYQVSVPAGTHLFVILDSAGNGYNAELYVRFGALPTTSVYDRKSSLPFADQAADISSTQPGIYYILVRSVYGGWNFSITAHSNSSLPALEIGTATSGTMQGTWDVKFYQLPVSAGENLTLIMDTTTSGYTSELYVKFGALPATGDYDLKVGPANGDQVLQILNTQAGVYYLLLRSTYGGWSYTLNVNDAGSFPITELTLGEPRDITVTSLNPGWFQVEVPSGAENLFLTLQKTSGWGSQIQVYRNNQVVLANNDYEDQRITLPDPTAGTYLIVVSGAGSGRLTANTALPDLELGQWKVGTIYRSWGSAWYQLDVPPGQAALFFHLETLGLWSQLKVYRDASFSGQYWSASGDALDLEISTPAPGVYYIEIIDSAWIDGEDPSRDYQIKADIAPIAPPACAAPSITSYNPTLGGAGPVTLTISGGCLDQRASVCLRRTGQADLCAATVTGQEDKRQLLATFDLSTAGPGVWTLRVIYPNGQSAIAAEPFTVEGHGEVELWVDIVGRDQFRVGRTTTYVVRYGNRGAIDAIFVYLVLGIPAELNAEVRLPSLMTELKPYKGNIAYSGELLATVLYISVLPAGAQGEFEVGISSGRITNVLTMYADITQDSSAYLDPVPLDPLAFLGLPSGSALPSDQISQDTESAIYSSQAPDCSANPPVGYVLRWNNNGRGPGYPYEGGSFKNHAAKSDGKGEFVEMVPVDGIRFSSVGDWVTSSGECIPPYQGAVPPPYYNAENLEDLSKVIEKIRKLVADDMIDDEYNWDPTETTGLLCDSAFVPAGPGWPEPVIKTNCEGMVKFLNNPYYYNNEKKYGHPWDWLPDDLLDRFYQWDHGRVSNDRCSEPFEDLLMGDADKTLQSIMSISPENKFGPTGWDAPGVPTAQRKRWIPADKALDYRIDFWNKENAPAATGDVVITDTLDADLDWSTFRFTEVGFLDWRVPIEPTQVFDLTVQNVTIDFSRYYPGQPSVSMDVNVKGIFSPETGAIEWRFRAVDPKTGEPPENPYAGFLPPITDSGWEVGWVSYTVLPKAGLPSGAQITNQAWVKFDLNEPNPAPKAGPFRNTLDAKAPTSAVTTSSGTRTCSSFMVAWSGKDEPTGSGLGGYEVYVDDLSDSDPAYLWLSNVDRLREWFQGQPGHQYGFYTRARDHAGNLEAAPASYDASVTAGMYCSWLPVIRK
jgi:hypothetical protein